MSYDEVIYDIKVRLDNLELEQSHLNRMFVDIIEKMELYKDETRKHI